MTTEMGGQTRVLADGLGMGESGNCFMAPLTLLYERVGIATEDVGDIGDAGRRLPMSLTVRGSPDARLASPGGISGRLRPVARGRP
ncbi:hypothetical protein Ssi02_12260 [Sinosporangium siamense]|uniref:Uncharacterized protein n=1 Tax=Sinosporangium siamense TaxID=1367973 RepID=A0A919RDX0_9ACTN|nr:hypothetical protein Ssi02_12260 [Sinosporangium siamense]